MSSVETSDVAASKHGGPRWGRQDTARQFLPAALEILETPASPVGRAIGGLIFLFFAVAIIWAAFGQVDIIATAQGKIVPTGRTKTIQPLETGIVAAIHVQDGDKVTAGQVLIELDRTVTLAERKHVTSDLISSQLDVARLTALRDSFESGAIPRDIAVPSGASEADVVRTKSSMRSQAGEQVAKLASIVRQIEQTKAGYERQVLNDLSDAEKKVAELSQDLIKAEQKTEEQVLRSPIDGTVQQLAMHTVGGVVGSIWSYLRHPKPVGERGFYHQGDGYDVAKIAQHSAYNAPKQQLHERD